MRGIAASCVLACCGGCTLLFASNLEGGDPPPAQNDAASPTDGAVPDGGTSPVDASVSDAPDVQTDGATRFCTSLSPAPKFCSDFDTPGAALTDGWNGLFFSPQGIGVADLSDIARDGKAMRMKLNDAPGCSYGVLEKELPTNGKDMRVSFSVRPTSPWMTDAIYALIRLGLPLNSCEIFLHLGTSGGQPSGGDIHFQYGSGPIDDVFNTSAFPKADVWSKIEVTVRANSTVLLTVDGVTATDRGFPSGCVFTDKVTLGLGFHCENGSPEMRYDDVAVDYP